MKRKDKYEEGKLFPCVNLLLLLLLLLVSLVEYKFTKAIVKSMNDLFEKPRKQMYSFNLM